MLRPGKRWAGIGKPREIVALWGESREMAALWGASQQLSGESYSGSLGRVTAARWDEVHGSVHGAGGRWLCPRLSGQ